MAKAVKVLLPLAKAGDPKAQRLLGYIYELTDGTRGVKRDTTKARFWYEKAVKQDHTPALRELGIQLIREFRDAKRGFRLLKTAGARGDAKAQFTLGLFHTSSKWDLIDQFLEKRNKTVLYPDVREDMTKSQIVESQRRAKVWLEAHGEKP